MGRVEIAIAVVLRGDQVLIGQRPAGVALAGLWEFPGGKVEPGETPAQAAERECREETGLSVTAVGEYPQVEHSYQHGDVRLHFMKCELCAAPNDSTPRAPFRWVPRTELTNYEFPAANRALIQQLLATP